VLTGNENENKNEMKSGRKVLDETAEVDVAVCLGIRALNGTSLEPPLVHRLNVHLGLLGSNFPTTPT
jgi:hypothetical protein